MTSSVLDTVLKPFAECLTPKAARQLSELRADPVAQAKFDELAGKSNEGTLSAEEHIEYDQMIAAFHLITILQARARAILKSQADE